MKMKKILIITLLFAFAIGCTEKKIVESKYDNGKPKVVKYYHKDNGEMVLDREIIYYKNAKKKMEGGYKEMQRDGHWKAWYEDGTIWSEGEYKDGKRSGIGIAYHENGKKYIEGMYRDDERIGVWHFYDTAGALLNEVNFDLVPKALSGDSVK